MFLVGVEEVELDMIRFRFVRLVLLISRWGGRRWYIGRDVNLGGEQYVRGCECLC